jgi:hypothetical protein
MMQSSHKKSKHFIRVQNVHFPKFLCNMHDEKVLNPNNITFAQTSLKCKGNSPQSSKKHNNKSISFTIREQWEKRLHRRSINQDSAIAIINT